MNGTLEKYKHLLSREKTPLENFITLQKTIMKDGCRHLKPMQKENLLWIGDQKPFQQIDPEIVPFLKQNFPASKFIHLVRHPFPVVRSSRVFIGDLWKGMPEEEILKRWTMHENWVILEKNKNEVPMLDVKYEDIVENTESETAKMFNFLEVEYDKSLLQEARRTTTKLLKLHPRLNCPPETQAIMSQFGYKDKSLLLESSLYVNFINSLRKAKKKITGSW
jgi:hypothetical protein